MLLLTLILNFRYHIQSHKSWHYHSAIPIPEIHMSLMGLSLLYTIIHWTLWLFSDWPKAYSELSKSAPVTSQLQIILTIIMSRTLKVTGNVKLLFINCQWRLERYVIMAMSPIRTDTSLIQTFRSVRSVSVLEGFDCNQTEQRKSSEAVSTDPSCYNPFTG